MTNLPPPSGDPALATMPAPPSGPPLPSLPSLAPRPMAVASPHAAAEGRPAGDLAEVPATRYVATAPLLPHVKTPSGLVIRKSIAPMRTTGLQGALMALTFLIVTAWLVVVARHFAAADRFVQRLHDRGVRAGDVALAKAIDERTIRYLVILGALYVVGMAATAWWSRRVALNVEALGERDTNVTLATWIWFAPLAWWFAGFNLLRRTPRSDWPVASWQLPFVAPFIAAYIVWRAFGIVERSQVRTDGDVSVGTLVAFAHAEKMVAMMFVGFSALAVLGAVYTVATFRATFAEIETTRREAQAQVTATA